MTVQHVFLELNQVYFRGQYTNSYTEQTVMKNFTNPGSRDFLFKMQKLQYSRFRRGWKFKKKIQKDRKQNYWKLEQLLKFRSQFIAINVTESSHYPSMQEFSKKPKQSINEHGCYGYVFFCKADTMIKKKKIAATVNTENCCQ